MKIEKNIPIPRTPRPTHTDREELSKLEIGDSIGCMDLEEARRYWAMLNKVFGGKSSTMRQVSEKDFTYRIWRIK